MDHSLFPKPKSNRPYRVLVTGWRYWPPEAAYVVYWALNRATDLWMARQYPVIVIDGQSPYGGVDDYANDWASSQQPRVMTERYPAERASNGRLLGGQRNTLMVSKGADVCLAFPHPSSVGTVDCMRKAERAGIRVVEIPWDPVYVPGLLTVPVPPPIVEG